MTWRKRDDPAAARLLYYAKGGQEVRVPNSGVGWFDWLKRLFGFGQQTVPESEEPAPTPAPRMEPPDNAAAAEAEFGESYKGVIEISPKGVRIVTAPLFAGGISHNTLARDNPGPISEDAYRIGFIKSGDYLELDSGLPWHKTITAHDIPVIRRALQEGGFLEGIDPNRTLIRIHEGDNPSLYTLNGNRIRT